MNKENPPDFMSPAARLSNADQYHKEDMALSRAAAEASESHETSEGLIHEVEHFLTHMDDILQTEAELETLLQKLDTAIAISNDPYARELRKRLKEEYHQN